METGVFFGQGIQIFSEKNVYKVDIRKNEINFGLVRATILWPASNDGPYDLQHWRYTSTAGNHTEMSHHVRRIDHGSLGPLDLNSLSNLEGGHVFGDVASWIAFQEQVEVARILIRRNRSIGTYHLFGLTGNCGSDGDVLANGKTQDIRGVGKFETVASRSKTKW